MPKIGKEALSEATLCLFLPVLNGSVLSKASQANLVREATVKIFMKT